MAQICRHGFYYVVVMGEGPPLRRRGKALRNALFVIRESKFGMQGRLQLFQEHPFECQSNYCALGSLRCSFDMQDLRRVLPEDAWLDGELPHVGNRTEYGYMNTYEWDGVGWVHRRVDAKGEPLPDLPDAPAGWSQEIPPEEWYNTIRECLGETTRPVPSYEDRDLLDRLEGEAIASFSDGLNTGFYINAYITKHCP